MSNQVMSNQVLKSRKKTIKDGEVINLDKYAENPFIKNVPVTIKNKKVFAGKSKGLIDSESGEITHTAEIMQIKMVDEQEFIKVYTSQVKAFFELESAGYKVMQIIFAVCQKSVGIDRIYLDWFEVSKVSEENQIKISKATFYRGMKELMLKNFLAESISQNMYFINPNLFFNGDRAKFITEYRKTKQPSKIINQNDEE